MMQKTNNSILLKMWDSEPNAKAILINTLNERWNRDGQFNLDRATMNFAFPCTSTQMLEAHISVIHLSRTFLTPPNGLSKIPPTFDLAYMHLFYPQSAEFMANLMEDLSKVVLSDELKSLYRRYLSFSECISKGGSPSNLDHQEKEELLALLTNLSSYASDTFPSPNLTVSGAIRATLETTIQEISKYDPGLALRLTKNL